MGEAAVEGWRVGFRLSRAASVTEGTKAKRPPAEKAHESRLLGHLDRTCPPPPHILLPDSL